MSRALPWSHITIETHSLSPRSDGYKMAASWARRMEPDRQAMVAGYFLFGFGFIFTAAVVILGPRLLCVVKEERMNE